MGVISSPALIFLVALVLANSVYADLYDGKPRPPGFRDKPTTTLGAEPAVNYEGKPADCMWYAWENINYDPLDTKNCSTELWAALRNDAPKLSGFEYYFADYFFDPDAEEYFCVIGCFNLKAAASGPSTPPATSPTTSAPPPATSDPPPMTSAPPPVPPPVTSAPPPVVPPPVTSAPPPVAPPPATSAPPPLVAPPPPATLFRPPPPGVASPPPSVVMSPTSGGPTQAPGPAAQTNGGSVVVFPAWSVGVAVIAAVAVVLGFAV